MRQSILFITLTDNTVLSFEWLLTEQTKESEADLAERTCNRFAAQQRQLLAASV